MLKTCYTEYGDNMGLFNKFVDTKFKPENLKEVLGNKISELEKLSKEYPDNNDIKRDLYGLRGEREVYFCLKNANIGMYVLHDINLYEEDLKSQIDYIVITPAKCYLIECKNLSGEITIDSNGQFIRNYNGSQKAIESPLRQAERHRETLLKIINNNKVNPVIDLLFSEKAFNKYYVPLVVFCNKSTIINNEAAPEEIRNRIIRSEELVSYIKQDIEQTDKIDMNSQKAMEEQAKAFLKRNTPCDVNYEEKYHLNDNLCPKCSGELVKRNGKYGEFYGCSNYPKCKYTREIKAD